MPKARKTLCLLLSALLLLAALALPAVAAPPDSGSKVVRVGYYHEKNFSEGHNDAEVKHGYAYEYYQLLTRYTGWRYEYVYGSYPELYQKLVDGEIDLLAGLGYLPERADLISFPAQPMGHEYYDLVRRAYDGRFSSDLSSLQGTSIGVVEGAIAKHTAEFLAANGLQARLVSFSSLDGRDFALRSGQVDLMVAEDTLGNYSGLEAFYQMAPSEFYVAVNRRRPDLLAELNAAQKQLFYDHANILDTLREKYLRRTAARASLSEDERKWIAEHGELVIGYVDNTMPLAGTDAAGRPTGLLKSYIPQMLMELRLADLPVSYHAFPNSKEMVAALASHQIDAIFPSDNAYWLAEQGGLHPSDKIFSVPMQIMYLNAIPHQLVKSVAVCAGNKYQEVLIRFYYPQAEAVFYPTQTACLEAVLNGKADITILNGLLTVDLLRSYTYKGLQSSLLDNRDFGFAVAAGDTRLLKLLNRGIGLMEPDYAQSILQQYNYHQSQTVEDFLHAHIVLALSLAVLFVLLCLLVIFIYVQASRHDREMTAQLEQALTAAQQASQAKTSFLFSMSHDIRTPMNAILGFNELIPKHLGQREQILDYVQKIDLSGHFLLTLINNVLDIARIESGQATVDNHAYDMKLIYQQLNASFEAVLAAKKLQVVQHWHITHNIVVGDELKVQQIMLNLAGNAVKYTPEGGRIDVTVEELPGEQEGWCLMRVSIADTGIGMSEDFLPHIFEEFSREHTSTESKVVGTGLGMPIVKKLVDLLGGTIEVRSRLGEGTTFTVTLPHRLASEAEQAEFSRPGTEATPDDFTGRRLLLAEDNELNAEIAIELLSSVGFAVDHAADGAICVKMLEEAAPGYYDLILMDVQMPNMDGYEATAAIRALPDRAKAGIPIAAMTANAFAEDKRKAREAGMNAHIAKPIEVDVMLKTIAGLL